MIASLSPIVAKIRPTSPRGTMPMPTSSRSPGDPNIPAADASLPETAMTNSTAGDAEHRRLRELLDVDLDPDREEEDRDEEVADRLQLTTDAIGRGAPTEREAGDERTDDRGELRDLGELGDREREGERERDQRARRLAEAGDPVEQPRNEPDARRPR